MKMKKWTYEIIIVAILACIGLCVWWYISTEDERQATAEFKQLVEFANRQQVEIAIIKQATELGRLKADIATRQQKQQNELAAQKQKLQNELK